MACVNGSSSIGQPLASAGPADGDKHAREVLDKTATKSGRASARAFWWQPGARRTRQAGVEADRRRPYAPGNRAAHVRQVRQACARRHVRRIHRRFAVPLHVGSRAARRQPDSLHRHARAAGRSSRRRPGAVELEPTTTTATRSFACATTSARATNSSVAQPAARDWILVGIAEGTAAYNTIAGNMETATAADREEGLQTDGRSRSSRRAASKATSCDVAYDSAREKEDARDSSERHHRA